MAFTTALPDIVVTRLFLDLRHGITLTVSQNVSLYSIGRSKFICVVALYPNCSSQRHVDPVPTRI